MLRLKYYICLNNKIREFRNGVIMLTSQSPNYAGFWIRAAASILDVIFISPPIYLIFDVLLRGNTNFFITFAELCLSWSYSFILTYLFGQTLGKMIVGIKVMPATNEKISWDECLLREVIGKILSTVLLCAGYILVAFDRHKQSLHDKFGKTYVVWHRNK